MHKRKISAAFLLAAALFLPAAAKSKNTKITSKLPARSDTAQTDIEQSIMDALSKTDKVVSIAFESVNFLNIMTVISRDESGYQVINYSSVNADQYRMFYSQWQNNGNPHADSMIAMRVGAKLMQLQNNRYKIPHERYDYEIKDGFGNSMGVVSISKYKKNTLVNKMIENMMAAQASKFTGGLNP